MAGALPILQAIGPIISGVFSMMNSPPEPPEPTPPPPPPTPPAPEASKSVDVEVDQEAARQRALKRRRAAQTGGLSLLSTNGGSSGTSGNSGSLTGY